MVSLVVGAIGSILSAGICGKILYVLRYILSDILFGHHVLDGCEYGKFWISHQNTTYFDCHIYPYHFSPYCDHV